ncbi:hypothetical protein FYK55_04565 [Roseiconus nitratireducens]|uniref:Tetratricopeptide repeat protein n=1 Tax=Roseiconus nitratireducens TaxID=2605748 RepID=A0A5M6DFJ6_9BACT|nr:hypothetical protein [Roseiconus nitratireducens]KAA5546173.1 hypothetical protein FYK55_04565 [Roseiconus nitratireducens]
MMQAPAASLVVGRWLLPLCAGILLGAMIGLFAKPMVSEPDAGQESFDNGLLVTQQLDSLFRVVESQLQEDASNLASHRELLDTFQAYDRLYVQQPSVDPATQLAKAYAARRLGHGCQALGELEDAGEYYRQSRDLFAACLQADPHAIDLYSLWLNAHTQIIYVELTRGDLDAAKHEYHIAVGALQQPALTQDFDYHKSMMLELKALAELGIELKLYAEAMQVAERFAFSAKVLTDRSPNDAALAQDAEDAQLYLRILSSLLRQQEKL